MTLTYAPTGSARSGEWLPDPGFGVYVHIPFCRHRCNYCDFNTYEGLDALQAPYVDALVRDICRFRMPVPPATSVFFGGGTPTLLGAASLARILEAVQERVGLAADTEVTIEANPETIDVAKLEELLAAGFTRISIGVQSLAPAVLERLGRTHPAEAALAAIAAARSAGFEDVNADLIYGSPWETEADWVSSLDGVIATGVDHVSAYALTIEEGTPLATLVATGRMPDVDPDLQARRHALAEDRLGTAGFRRYEISNWSKPGRASRHNVLYWSAGDYAGFGAGAHSHTSGRRSWATRLPRDFIAAVDGHRPTEDGCEVLDEDARGGEALMLGLRLASGVDAVQFGRRFGDSIIAARRGELARLTEVGLLEWDAGRLRLSRRGTLLANDVLCRLL